MFYYLFHYLDQHFNLPGAGVFQYISFRAALALMTSLIITMLFGKRIITYIQKKQIGETIRELGLEGQTAKAGTPTMGGLIILAAIIIPTLLFAKVHNIYIVIMLISTVWLGSIGFIDDYIKVFKKNKEGLQGKFKVVGQIGIGLLVGAVFYFHPDVVIKERVVANSSSYYESQNFNDATGSQKNLAIPKYATTPIKTIKTTIPFLKNNEFDYARMASFMGDKAQQYGWLIFIPIVILIVTAVSNGANITDGID
jgi:phospho-N-acetylmuramoyl-pentapeptide-transferase